MIAPATAEETVLLHAAGSLRVALTEVANGFEAAGLGKVQTKFGPSGILKNEIAAGAAAEVFASANMEHPQALASEKRSGPVVLFARNRLCALVRPGLEVTPASLLARMLDPQMKLGTSTPKADPSGDYAWEVFQRAEKITSRRLRHAREESAAAYRRAVQPARAAGPLGLRRTHRARERRYLPHLLHQRAGRAAGKSRATDRATAGRIVCGSPLRPDRHQRRLGTGVQIRALHSLGGRTAHAGETRFRSACSAAIGIRFDHDRTTKSPLPAVPQQLWLRRLLWRTPLLRRRPRRNLHLRQRRI